MAKARGYGTPRADWQRAMEHYGVTEAEYCANPEAYPLPARGAGFSRGTAAGTGGFTIWHALIMGVIGFVIYKVLFSRKKVA